MATRSNIFCKVGDTYTKSYCHWDGFIEHNGFIIVNKYNSQKSAEKLVNMGYLMSLSLDDNRIEPAQQGGDQAINCRNPMEHPEDYFAQDYNYLWDGERWLYSNTNEFINKEWSDLKKTVDEIAEKVKKMNPADMDNLYLAANRLINELNNV